VYDLIGGDSPMQQHMRGRLTAAVLRPGTQAQIELPCAGDDLFVYVTDGAGWATHADTRAALGQYDVMLVRSDAAGARVKATADRPLHFLNFYLPHFIPQPGELDLQPPPWRAAVATR
jgi:hypothetical protein